MKKCKNNMVLRTNITENKKKPRKSSCNCYWTRRNILIESNDKEIQFLV